MHPPRLAAHAVVEAREKTTEAGMDDYPAGPVDDYALETLIDRAVPADRCERYVVTHAREITPDDHRDALRSPGGDRSLLDELFAVFEADLPERTRGLSLAFDERNFSGLGLEAHSLKSSAATIGAGKLSRLAAELEKAARTGDLQAVVVAWERMRPDMNMYKRSA
jgi:HPt (histidine-containing phosphotransfer) domain-containing protein